MEKKRGKMITKKEGKREFRKMTRYILLHESGEKKVVIDFGSRR